MLIHALSTEMIDLTSKIDADVPGKAITTKPLATPFSRRGHLTWTAALLLVFCTQVSALTLTTEEYPPFNFSTDGGKTITGSSSDLMREIMKRNGTSGTITLYPWSRAFRMALNDKNTCVYSTTRTEAREKQFKWVGPLVPSTWVLFAKGNSPLHANNLDELKSYRIGGYQGDAKAAFLKERGFTVEETINEEQNIKKLNAGRIDLWAATSEYGPWYAEKFNIKIKPILAFQEVFMYAACNRAMADEDIERMNAALKAIKADGSYGRIMDAYR